MEIIGFIAILGVGIALGMYITTQIAEGIDRNVSQKKFMDDMNSFDKKRTKTK